MCFRKLLCIFICLLSSSFILHISAQSFKKEFKVSEYDAKKKGYVERTMYVYITLDDGNLVSLSIEAPSHDPNVEECWYYLGGSYLCEYNNLIVSLKSARNKYKHWLEATKNSKPTNYAQELIDDIQPFPPIYALFRLKNDPKGVFLVSKGKEPCVRLAPYVSSDDRGNKILFMGFDYLTGKRDKEMEGWIPSLWSMLLTSAAGADKEERTIRNIIYQFNSVAQVQTLIDALDIKKEISQYNEKKKEEQKKNVTYDNLFK